jgi:Flp pilus assembly protein TadG
MGCTNDDLTNPEGARAAASGPRDLGSILARLGRDRRGVSAIVIGLSASTILASAGFAVDAGLWYNDKRTVQGVADLAAWTALQTYTAEGFTTTATADGAAAAQAIASANGFQSGTNGVTVTVNYPPKSGSHTAATCTSTSIGCAFEVTVSKSENLFFSAPYLKTLTVASRAVSMYQATIVSSGSPGCMVALLPGATAQINIGNGANVNASNCGMYANGSSSSAIDITGGAKVSVDYVQVVGGVSVNNGATLSNSGSQKTSSSSTPDPYAGLTLSQIESSTGTTINCSSYGGVNESSWQSTPYQLSPGVYCGGLSVSNGNSMNLSPGVYYMVGGNLSIMSGTDTLNGVTIVMVPANGVNPTFQVGNGANLTMTSMSSGVTAGIAVYQDPSNTTAVSICGSSGANTVNIDGTIYAPGAAVDVANGCNINATAALSSTCFEIVAGTISLQGGMGAAMNNCSAYGVKYPGQATTVITKAMVE